MQDLKTRMVRLWAPRDVEIRPGPTLPAGFYPGHEDRLKQTGSGQDVSSSQCRIEAPARPLMPRHNQSTRRNSYVQEG